MYYISVMKCKTNPQLVSTFTKHTSVFCAVCIIGKNFNNVRNSTSNPRFVMC